MFKTTEKKLNKLGFVKVKDDKYGITYEKKVDEYNYTHVVDILHKNSGKHILQSYSKENTTNEGSLMVGLKYNELKLFTKEMKRVGLNKERRLWQSI